MQTIALSYRGLRHLAVLCFALAVSSLLSPPSVGAPKAKTDNSKNTVPFITQLFVYGSDGEKTNMRQNFPQGYENWGVVKKPNDWVIMLAATQPNDMATVNKIVWNNGESVPGKTNAFRRFSRSEAKKFEIKPSIGGTVTKKCNLWVMWVELNAHLSPDETTPPNAVQFPPGDNDGTQQLGPVTYNGGKSSAGKVVIVGRILPLGAGKVAGRNGQGWNVKRHRQSSSYQDGVASTANLFGDPNSPIHTPVNWIDDTSFDEWKKLTPDNADKIYDTDSPNCIDWSGTGVQCGEINSNMRQWATFNGEVASDQWTLWLWQAAWSNLKTPKAYFKYLVTGNITPHAPESAGCP